jgi:hypothetical protein
LDIDIPLDIREQFTRVIDFCYDVDIELSEKRFELFALFLLVTVHHINGLVEKTLAAFPDPPWNAADAISFLIADRYIQTSSVEPKTGVDFPVLESRLELAASQIDRVFPFIVDILPVTPLPKLCNTLSWWAVVKIAELETSSAPSHDNRICAPSLASRR